MTVIIENLSGLLPLGEKKKLLNQFVQGVGENEVDNVLKECQQLPTKQYHMLKLGLADRFHRWDLIVELLCNAEKEIISKAVAQRWMYEYGATQLSDSEYLINKLFPNVSYGCRQKLLNRIGLYMNNEVQVDHIFKAVEEKYGLHVAFPLIQQCSKGTITSVITKRKILLQPHQLLLIMRKDSDIGLEYLKNYYTKPLRTYCYRRAIEYLFVNHPDKFVELFLSLTEEISFKLGRIRSTQIIRTHRAQLLVNPKKFCTILRFDRICREYKGEDFQSFFQSTLSTSVNVISNEIWKWVKTRPVEQHLDMISTAFSKLYQINIYDNPEYMDTRFITLLPEEKRASAIQWKIDNDKTYGWGYNDVFLYFYKGPDQKAAWDAVRPISQSVPELKKALFSEQQTAARAFLCKCLIVTCYVNHDLAQLIEVLALLNKRSRNDQGEVRCEIFRVLEMIMKDMAFTKDHWDVVIEMVQTALIFKDPRDFSDTYKMNIAEKCLAFLIKSNLPAQHVVSMIVKMKLQTNDMNFKTEFLDNAADKKLRLELFIKELECLHTNRSGADAKSVTSEYIASFIEEICKFNKRKATASSEIKPILIASHQWLRDRLEDMAKKEEENMNTTSDDRYSSIERARQFFKIIHVLRDEQKLSLDAFTDADEFFTKILKLTPKGAILTHFLYSNPSKLNEHWPTIFAQMLKYNPDVRLMEQLRTLNYATLIAQSIRICSEILAQKVEPPITIRQKCNAVHVLSILNDSASFLSLAAQHYPVDGKVDVFADNSTDDYQLREAFARALLNVDVSHLAFPAIEKFCVGDYLKLTVGSLRSQASHASQTRSLAFLRPQIFNTRVSLQKHIIRLYFTIGSVEEKIAVLREMDSSNASIRFEMFQQALKLLATSPSEKTWAILSSIMTKMSSDDVPVVQYLILSPNVDSCPMEYVSHYILACLNVLRKGKAEQVDGFLNHLVYVMDDIPENTFDEIFISVNCDTEVSFNSHFCIQYLVKSPSESVLAHRISNMWRILQNALSNCWDRAVPRMYDVNSYDYPTRTLISTFIFSLCTHKNKPPKEWLMKSIFESFVEKLKSEFMAKAFKEILYFELSLLLLQAKDKEDEEKLKLFGRNLAQFIDSLTQKFGGEIINIIFCAVKSFVTSAVNDDANLPANSFVFIIDGMLQTSESRQNQIISNALLNEFSPKSEKSKALYEQLKERLNRSDDIVVHIYRNYSET